MSENSKSIHSRFAASIASMALAASMIAGPASAGLFHHSNTGVKHHSALKGAVVGGVAGHVVGGRKGAVAGAIIGAEVQHHKNKKAEKRAAQGRS